MNKELSLKDVIEVAYENARKFMQYDQPIEEYEKIKNEFNSGKLDSAIREAFQTSGGKYLIRGFYMQASALFYYLSKAHALVNGNKRLAVTSLMVFMAKNGRWINMPDQELIELSIMIASSDRKVKDTTIELVAGKIKKFTVSSSKMPR
jgi:death on curing protein